MTNHFKRALSDTIERGMAYKTAGYSSFDAVINRDNITRNDEAENYIGFIESLVGDTQFARALESELSRGLTSANANARALGQDIIEYSMTMVERKFNQQDDLIRKAYKQGLIDPNIIISTPELKPEQEMWNQMLAAGLVRDVDLTSFSGVSATAFAEVTGSENRGDVAWIADQSTDLPTGDYGTDSDIRPISFRMFGNAVEVGMFEAIFNPDRLQERLTRSRMTRDIREYEIALKGGGSHVGIYGFINHPDIPLATLPNGATSGTPYWNDKTPQEISFDLYHIQQTLIRNQGVMRRVPNVGIIHGWDAGAFATRTQQVLGQAGFPYLASGVDLFNEQAGNNPLLSQFAMYGAYELDTLGTPTIGGDQTGRLIAGRLDGETLSYLRARFPNGQYELRTQPTIQPLSTKYGFVRGSGGVHIWNTDMVVAYDQVTTKVDI